MTEKRFTLVDDYLIEYDGSYFDLHKTSDIRSLVTVIGYVTDENEQLKKILGFLKNDNANAIVDVLNLQETTIWELKQKNEQLKEILNQAVKQMEVEMDKNSTKYYVGLLIDAKMYKKIKGILK